MPVIITKYLSLDGKTFDDFDECAKYEENLKLEMTTDEKMIVLFLYKIIIEYSKAIIMLSDVSKHSRMYSEELSTYLTYTLIDEDLKPNINYYILKELFQKSLVDLSIIDNKVVVKLPSYSVIDNYKNIEIDYDFSVDFELLEVLDSLKENLTDTSEQFLRFYFVFFEAMTSVGINILNISLEASKESLIQLESDKEFLSSVDIILDISTGNKDTNISIQLNE